MRDFSVYVEHLRSGRVVAAATESSFALMADARNAEALDLLFSLKGRAASKAVALMVPNLNSWLALVSSVPDDARRLAATFWPGPLTIALPTSGSIDPRLLVEGSVGVRVPGESAALRVVQAFGGPLTATSANLAGEPPVCDGSEVPMALSVASETVMVVPGRSPGGPPSTIVVFKGGVSSIARAGAVPSDAISRCLLEAVE